MSYETEVFKNDNALRFLDKGVNLNERSNYKKWWQEQINLYGTEANYYTNNYSLTEHDPLYGEQPSQRFSDPKKIVLAVTLNENAVVLGKFGLISDDEITAFISIESYTTSFGENTEPKSGDVFELIELGEDRVGGRGARKFEITERADEDINLINPILGHYIWLIKAKRFDFSHEGGIEPEPASNQVYDNDFAGIISPESSRSAPKSYSDDIDKEAASVFDYSMHGNHDDVYGDYQ